MMQIENEKFGLPPGKGVLDVAPDENETDNFAKRKLRIHQYVRYMDDIVMISDSREQLVGWRSAIEAFMHDRLRLDLNPKKTFIQPISHGIDFCQYRIYPDHIRLKKKSATLRKAIFGEYNDEEWTDGWFSLK